MSIYTRLDIGNLVHWSDTVTTDYCFQRRIYFLLILCCVYNRKRVNSVYARKSMQNYTNRTYGKTASGRVVAHKNTYCVWVKVLNNICVGINTHTKKIKKKRNTISMQLIQFKQNQTPDYTCVFFFDWIKSLVCLNLYFSNDNSNYGHYIVRAKNFYTESFYFSIIIIKSLEWNDNKLTYDFAKNSH